MRRRTKNARIKLCAEVHQRDLIDRAAELTFKSRTDFILEASCEKAQGILLHQHLFIISEEQFDIFEQALSQPLSENKGFQDLMSQKYE